LFTRDHTRIEIPENLSSQIQELALPVGTVLDGEIWNPEKRGAWRHSRKTRCMLTFWDVIRTGYENLEDKPLSERYQILRNLLAKNTEDISIIEQFEADSKLTKEIYESAITHRNNIKSRSGYIHGIVLKRKNSPRRDHATKTHEHPDWLKIVFEGMSGWAPR
jgi:ATP-dependent DNA ligase